MKLSEGRSVEQALGWVVAIIGLNSEFNPGEIAVRLTVTPHGMLPMQEIFSYRMDWTKWRDIPDRLTQEHARQQLANACVMLMPEGCKRFRWHLVVTCEAEIEGEPAIVILSESDGEIDMGKP